MVDLPDRLEVKLKFSAAEKALPVGVLALDKAARGLKIIFSI